METNYAYSLEQDENGKYIDIDYYEWVKKRSGKGYGWGNHIKNVQIHAGDILLSKAGYYHGDVILHIIHITEISVKFNNLTERKRDILVPYERFVMMAANQFFPVKNPLQFLECFVRRGNLMGFPPPKGIITKEVSDDHEFIIVKPKPHRGGIPFGVKPTPEQLERILRKELARQKALEEKEKKKPTMADILIGNIRALRNYAQKVYEAHRDGEYTISDTQKAEIDKQLEKKDKVINKLKKHW